MPDSVDQEMEMEVGADGLHCDCPRISPIWDHAIWLILLLLAILFLSRCSQSAPEHFTQLVRL